MESKRAALGWMALGGWLAVLAFLGTTTLFPVRPGDTIRSVTRMIIHAGEYAVLATIIAWLLGRHTRQPRLVLLPLAFVLAVLVAALDEWHQTIVPGRAGRIADVEIDTLGAGLGLLMCEASRLRTRRR